MRRVGHEVGVPGELLASLARSSQREGGAALEQPRGASAVLPKANLGRLGRTRGGRAGLALLSRAAECRLPHGGSHATKSRISAAVQSFRLTLPRPVG